MARPWNFRFLRLLAWLIGLPALGALAVVGIAWLFAHQALTIESGDVHADVLVVLGGGTDERPTRAAELFQAGVAPLVLVSGSGDNDINVNILERNGVPESAILREPASLSTLENAKFSVALLRQKGVHRVIIVTSWYHSRRAMACFQSAAPDLRFFSRPAYRTYPRHEWSRHGTSSYIRSEYLKLVGYWLCYGVAPLVKVS
jgi:uncharacterized SAM-binding protein YcdF (DUF218 family)